jgi:hypothetical protein
VKVELGFRAQHRNAYCDPEIQSLPTSDVAKQDEFLRKIATSTDPGPVMREVSERMKERSNQLEILRELAPKITKELPYDGPPTAKQEPRSNRIDHTWMAKFLESWFRWYHK